jgi:hypothetical protein
MNIHYRWEWMHHLPLTALSKRLFIMTGRADNHVNSIPVFGLTKAQLQPIIDNIADQPVASFHITVQHQVQGFSGYSADKIIPTFTYTTESGHNGKATVFVKRFHRTGPAEAHHYVHLQKHDAPIPRMYGVMTDPDGRELLFLEYLDPIGDVQDSERFFDDIHNFRHCLAATAHFNATKPSGEYAVQLPCKDVRKALRNACITLEHLWEHACTGDLGDALKKLCSESQDKLLQIQEFAVGLIEPIVKMDTGLIHGDVYPENTGWRRDTNELLILDLEWIGFGPRFWDAAMLLGAPDEMQHQHQRRDELSQHYLEQYAHWGGKAPSLKQFKEVTSTLWIAQRLSMIWFGLRRALDGDADWTDDPAETRQFFREGLYKELNAIHGLIG